MRRTNHPQIAFTLVELLVVITIIVILIALLLPTIDKAVYQAELAVCASRLDGNAVAVTAYTQDYRQLYPVRADALANAEVNKVRDEHPAGATAGWPPAEFSQTVKAYVPLNKTFQCPFVKPVDLEHSVGHAWASYSYWFGTAYQDPGAKAMRKLGDQWVFRGNSYRILMGDYDDIFDGNRWCQSSHPDIGRSQMDLRTSQDENVPGFGQYTASQWVSGPDRGEIDSQFVRNDGSVARYDKVKWKDDERMDRLPTWWTLHDYVNGTSRWSNVPRG